MKSVIGFIMHWVISFLILKVSVASSSIYKD